MRRIFILLLVPFSSKSIDITSFGGVGDGVFDNYYVFKVAAAYAAANPNTTITIPSGTFYIAKYRSTKNDTIDHIKWNSCSGLRIIGTAGAKISMNGTFTRYLNYVTPESCAKKSYTTGLSPFYFFHCNDLVIKNLEVTGNAFNTMRLPGSNENNPTVTEGSGTMLNFELCNDVIVDNMYLHHAEADGITISGDRVVGVWTNSTNFYMSNIRSEHNGRQGMSIGGLDSALFYKCYFSYTGFTEGDYGHNDPAAGVDIEPGEFHSVYNITFDSCYFFANRGAAFICSYPTTTSNITLRKCVVDSMGSEKPQGITILAAHSLVDSCYLNMGDRDFKVTNSDKPGATIGIRNSTIESVGTWINTASTNMTDSVRIHDNQINFLSDIMGAGFIMLNTTNLRFENNNIDVSPAGIASKPTGFHVFVRNAIISSGNVFSSGIRVDYTGTITVADP